MPTIDYPLTAAYQPAAGVPLVPVLLVELIRGGQSARAVGVVDSGATITVFNPEHAEILGIEDVREGQPERVSTQGGPVDYYVFDLEMQITLNGHTKRFPCRVGFFESRKPRNILGRNYIFSHYQIGFSETNQEIYLRPEE